MILREIITKYVLDADTKKVEAFNKQLEGAKKKADEAGAAVDNLGKKTRRPLSPISPRKQGSRSEAYGPFQQNQEAYGPFQKSFLSRASYSNVPSMGGGSGMPPVIPPGASAAVRNFEREHNQAFRSIGRSASDLRGLILKMVGAFTVGAIGVGGLFRLIGSMEQTEIAFETMIGDAEKAKKTLADLQNFAKTTPFNFADTADLSKRLLAFSFQAEELIPTMTALGNIAAGVGKEKLPQLVLALGQVKAAGKLRGSELRQFTEAGVPLIAELGKTLGIADSQVQQMVESGTVGFDKVWQSLQRVTGEGGRFNNLMQRQSGSLLGMFSNLVDSIQLMAIDMGKKGLLGKAKEFLAGIISMLETNRNQILNGVQAAVELTVSGLEKLIRIGKNTWQVFKGLANVFGGVRRTLDFMVKGIALIASARMLFLIGTAAKGLYTIAISWRAAGDAALLAQLKMAAVAVGIGLAIAAVALAIEDVVAYFQGRKSVTGLILGNLEGIGEKFNKFLGPIMDKIREFAKNVGRWMMDGLKVLTTADWAGMLDVLIAALEITGLMTTIPLRIGLAIAQGISEGLLEGMQKNFPKLASFLGLDDKPSVMPAPGQAQMAQKELGIGEGIVELSKLLFKILDPGPNSITKLSPSIIGQTPTGFGGMRVQAPITVTVPPGTPAEQVGPMVRAGVKEATDQHLREASRATAPVGDY